MFLKVIDLTDFSSLNVFKSREIAHKRRQYVHYLVYYVMAKLLIGGSNCVRNVLQFINCVQ